MSMLLQTARARAQNRNRNPSFPFDRDRDDPMETTNNILSHKIAAPPAWLTKKPSVMGHIVKERKELLLQCNMYAACAGKPLYTIGTNNSLHFSYICSRCKTMLDNGKISLNNAGSVYVRTLARTATENFAKTRKVSGPYQVYMPPKICECKL